MIIEFPAPGPLLSMNDRLHWRVRAERSAFWRHAAFYHGVHARNTARLLMAWPLTASTVEVTLPVRSLKTRRDPHNFIASVKPIVDGLVDAKFWPDDTADWVTVVEPTFWTSGMVLVEIHPREKPCVAIPCPPMEDIDLDIDLVVMDTETFYREHPDGVFGDPDE